MNTIELKSDIFNLIEQIEDEALLNSIKNLISKKFTFSKYGTIPDFLIDEFEESIIQSEREELFEHEQVLNEAKTKYLAK